MSIVELIDKFHLQILSNLHDPEKEVTGGYTGDLLSDVIANSKEGNVWITMQTHINIIAVAKLKELSAIIIVMNRQVDKDALDKANEEKILVLRTDLPAYRISGKFYEYGIK